MGVYWEGRVPPVHEAEGVYSLELEEEARWHDPQAYYMGQELGHRIVAESIGSLGRMRTKDPGAFKDVIRVQRDLFSRQSGYTDKLRSHVFGVMTGLEEYNDEMTGETE